MSDRRDEFSTIVRSILKNQPFKYSAKTDLLPETIQLLRDQDPGTTEAQLLKVLDRRLESYKNFFSKSLNLLQNFKSKVQEESKRISDDIAEQHAALMRVRNKYDSEMRNQINAKADNHLLTAVDMYWNRKSQEMKSPSSSVVFKDPHARLLWLESQGVSVDEDALQQAREASQHLRTLRNYKDNLEYAISDVVDLPLKALACSKAARIEAALRNARREALESFERRFSEYQVETAQLRSQQKDLFAKMPTSIGQIHRFYQIKMSNIKTRAFAELKKMYPATIPVAKSKPNSGDNNDSQRTISQ